MSSRISTRRSINPKAPCQEIQNIFIQPYNPQLNLIPDNIWKCLPNTQKVSCEIVDQMKQLKSKLTSQQTLKELRDNAQIQYAEIMKLVSQDPEPDNVPSLEYGIKVERENKIKKYESPIRKMVKKQNATKEISDYGSQDIKQDNIFIDNQVIEQLEDYLCID